MTIPKLRDIAQWKLTLGGLLVCASIAAGWLHEHDQRIRTDALFVERLASSEHAVAVATAYAKAASARVVHDSVRVTRTVHALDTLWRTVPETLRTAGDTEIAIGSLPVLRRATDSAIQACSDFQISCAEYRRRADSARYALIDQNAILRERVKQLQPGKVDAVKKWITLGAVAFGAFHVGQVIR